MTARLLLSLLVGWLLLAGPRPLLADQPAPPVGPTLEDRETLRNWWRELPSEQQDRLRERYRRYQKMTPEARRELEQRMERWKRMPPAQQHKIRRRFEAFQNLSPEERQHIRRNYRRWRQLEPGERERLRDRFRRFRSLPPEERHRIKRQLREERRHGRQHRGHSGGLR